jgi:hypothetical protein
VDASLRSERTVDPKPCEEDTTLIITIMVWETVDESVDGSEAHARDETKALTGHVDEVPSG